MGLELVSNFSKTKNEREEANASMIRHTESADRTAEIMTNTMLLTKADLMLTRLNDLEREIEQVKNAISAESTRLVYLNKDLSRTVTTTTEKNYANTENALHDMDESLDQLATAQMLKSTKRAVMATMSISIVSLVSVIAMAVFVFGFIR